MEAPSTMDRPRSDKRVITPKMLAAGAIAVVLIAVISVLMMLDTTTHRVKRASLFIGTVDTGDFSLEIAANGVLRSQDIALVSTSVDGRVARIYAAAGDVVGQGGKLLELSNPEITNGAEASMLAWQSAAADLKAYEVELQNLVLNQEAELLELKFGLEKKTLELKAESQLHDQGVVSSIDFEKTKLDVEQLQQMLVIGERRLEQFRSNTQVLIEARSTQVTQLEKVYRRAQSKVESLVLTASMAGVLQSFTVELGQRVREGDPLGKLAKQDQLYAELEVPVRHAAELSIGQAAQINTRNNSIDGVVERIEPEVSNGKIVVAVHLKTPLSKEARPQLHIEGTLFVARVHDALVLGKPAFVKRDQQTALFRLDTDGEYATRTSVHIGQVSPNTVEILDGLSPGDQIILSETDEWRHLERIKLY